MATSSSLACSIPRFPLSLPSFPSPSIFPSHPLVSPSPSTPSLCFKSSQTKQLLHLTTRKTRSWSSLKSSATESPSTNSTERWLLEPIGDGDCRHIGYGVPLPNAFEIASNAVTVGRLPEKSDMVIPVATVSGVHARLEKKEGSLLVTDLDSTNGTYINDKKLMPGAVATASPGSYITFGDTHLAMFRVSKIEEASLTSETNESEIKLEMDVPTGNLEAAS